MSRPRAVLTVTAVVAAASVAMVALGASLRDGLLLSALVALQAVAGGYLWTLAAHRDGGRLDPVEVAGAALGVGTALALLSGVVLDAVIPGHLGWLGPTVVAAVVWGVRRARGRTLNLEWGWRRSSLIAMAVALVGGLGSIFLNIARYPLGSDGPWTTYHRDMLYFEGLSTSVGVFGPGNSIFMDGTGVRYHWFAYGWVGQLAHTADAAPFVTLTRLLPLVALVGCAALVVGWAARLRDRTSVTVLAALLLVSGGYVGASNGTILNFDSPSQNLTTLWLLAALIAALMFVNGTGGWWLLVVAGLLAGVTTGGKVSSGALVVAPLLIVAIAATVKRQSHARRAWQVVIAAGLAAGLVYVLVIAGSASGGDLEVLSWYHRAASLQGLDSSKGARGVVLGTAGLILAMAARWWGLIWLVRDRQWRWRPEVAMGVGLVGAAILPVVILSQGVNETWFALAASAPLAVLSAVGLSVAWERIQSRGALLGSAIAAALIALVVPAFWIPDVSSTTSVRFWGPWVAYGLALAAGATIAVLRRPRAWLTLLLVSATTSLVLAGSVARFSPIVAARIHPTGATTTTRETPPTVDTEPTAPAPPAQPSAVTGDGAVAPVMEAPAELLAGSPPERTSWTAAEVEAAHELRRLTGWSDVVVTNDTTSFVVPALTQRLTYMSGAPYQALYGAAGQVSGIPSRIQTSTRFIQDLDHDSFDVLCAAGVRWGWVTLDGTPRRDWSPLADALYANDAVAIVRLRCP